MDKEELKNRLIDLHESLIMADEFGSDHHERKEMRDNFDELMPYLLDLISK
jgi:hypothetical protein